MHRIFIKNYLKMILHRKCSFFCQCVSLTFLILPFLGLCDKKIPLQSSFLREVRGSIFYISLSFFFGNSDLLLAFLILSTVSEIL